MRLLRACLLTVLLAVGATINMTVAPQIYVPRPPVANGIDIASTWEWRSMAIKEHSWWLAHYFPNAIVTNVAYGRPSSRPNSLRTGIQFASWRDPFLPISIDDSFPPVDVSKLGIREDLIEEGKVFSRIHCRDSQEMLVRDSCYYFVAWDDNLIRGTPLTFVGVRTNIDNDSEYALVEKEFLSYLVKTDLDTLPNLWDVDE